MFIFIQSIIGYINDNLFTGSGLKHLQKDKFGEIKIAIPPENVINAFNKIKSNNKWKKQTSKDVKNNENAKRNNIELDFEDIKDIASEILEDVAFNDDITNHLKNYDKEQEL